MSNDETEGPQADEASETATDVTTDEAGVDEVQAAAEAESGEAKPRLLLPVLLIVLATLLAVTGTLTTWVRVQALDTDAWVDVTDGLLDEPEVRDALSVYIVDVVYDELDVSGEVEALLPENLGGLSGPLSAALKSPATSGVDRILDSTAFRDAWSRLNRVTHQTLVNILRDETGPGTSTTDGVVALEIGELVRLVGENLGLSSDALDKIPEGAGQIVIFESDELASAQGVVRLLDFLSWFVLLVVAGLYAGAVYLGRAHAYRVLRMVGYGLMTGGAVILVARAVGIDLAVDSIVSSPSNESVAEVVAYVVTDLLAQVALSGIIFGVIILAFALLMGAGRRATAVRGVFAPAFNASVAAVSGGTAVALLLLYWFAPGRAFDRLVSAALLIALVIGAVVTLRKRTLSEFPTASFEAVGESIKSAATSVGERYGQTSSSGASGGTVASELAALRELHAEGGLTDDEFSAAKQSVLAGGTAPADE
jgi:hypothetical protein